MTTKWRYCNRSYYGTQSITLGTQDCECAYFVDVCARYVHVGCVYNYSHVVCCVQQLFLVASSYKLFNL